MDTRDVEGREPLDLFRQWMQEAEASEANDPNAVALATATKGGAPSVRMVLMKLADDRGFCFYTNAESEKGEQLTENPIAAMCFHWKSLRRQVRVEGQISELSAEQTDEYFHSRSRRSQMGAAVSRQSRVLSSREEMEGAVRQFSEANPGDVVPRPAYWKGYCLHPERVEFWQDGKDRLHDRFLFLRRGDGWDVERLWP